MKKSKRFFTLIELLVVIAIIAILASILLPALQQARESSKSASCVNQVKQLVMSVQFYSDSQDGWGPAPEGTEFTRWPALVYVNKDLTDLKTLICPSGKSMSRLSSVQRLTSISNTHWAGLVNRVFFKPFRLSVFPFFTKSAP